MALTTPSNLSLSFRADRSSVLGGWSWMFAGCLMALSIRLFRRHTKGSGNGGFPQRLRGGNCAEACPAANHSRTKPAPSGSLNPGSCHSPSLSRWRCGCQIKTVIADSPIRWPAIRRLGDCRIFPQANLLPYSKNARASLHAERNCLGTRAHR